MITLKDSSTLTMRDCLLSKNLAKNQGGCILIQEYSSLFIFNSTFVENKANDASLIFSYDIFEASIVFDTCFIFFSSSMTTLAEIFNGILIIRNSIISDNKNPTLFSSSAKIVIINSLFENNSCIGIQLGCSLFSTKSENNIEFSKFSEIHAFFTLPGVIYAEESNISLISSSLKDCSSLGRGSCLYSFKSHIIFKLVNLTKTIPSCIYISESNFELQNSLIGNNEKLDFAPFISESSNATILFSNFLNNHGSFYGGAIYSLGYLKFKLNTLFVNHCLFENNSANSEGGALFLLNQDILLDNSVFLNNKADYGGAISFKNTKSYHFEFIIFSSIFKKNFAFVEGGAIKYEEDPFLNKNNTFEGNLAVYGNDIASYPTRLGFQIFIKDNANNSIKLVYDSEINSEKYFIFDSIVSGSNLDYKLEFQLYDELGQKINNINERFIIIRNTLKILLVT